MREPYVNVCTDGLLGGRPHPRAYGTYPRILGRYVREQRRADARGGGAQDDLAGGRRACTFPIAGRIAPGQVGRPRRASTRPAVIDRATFADPMQGPSGIVHVVVAGVPVVADSRPTGARPGRAVRATTGA